MANPFKLPGLEQEQESLASQLAYADALRKKSMDTNGQMVGNIYVPKSPWQNALEGFAGAATRGYQETKKGERDQMRQDQEQQFFGDLQKQLAPVQTDVMNNRQAAELMGGDMAPQPRMVPKTPQEQLGIMQSAAMNAPPGSPYGSVLKQAALAQMLSAPQRELDREDAQAARLEQAVAQAQARMDQIREAEAQRRITREEADARAKETKREFMYLAQSLRPASGGSGEGGGGGKVPMGYRYKADGTLEAIPGGPADAKLNAAASKAEAGQSAVNRLLDEMDTNIDILDKAKGIGNPARGSLSNAAAWVQNTGPGQLVGKIAATTNQRARNNIETTASNLLLELKNAKGLTASQLNTQGELQRYLAAVAGGKDYDAESMRDTIKRSRELLGGAKGNKGGEGSFDAPSAPASGRKVYNPTTGRVE